jgi:MFS family permease
MPFFYFDMSFMVWVMLGSLGVQISDALNLDPAQEGLMVAVPLLAGALLRVVNGVLVDRIGLKSRGLIGQLIVIVGLVSAWYVEINSFAEIIALGVYSASPEPRLPWPCRWLAVVSARISGHRAWHRRRGKLRDGAGRVLCSYPCGVWLEEHARIGGRWRS